MTAIVAVDGDRDKCVLAAVTSLQAGFEAPDDLLRRRRGSCRGGADGQADRHDPARGGRRGAARRPAVLSVPDRRRVGMAKATAPSPVPTDPVELLATPLAKSGLAAGALLRRAGIRLGFYTVRDLLFHLPRRYDDLREMRKLGDLVWVEDGTVVSARVRVPTSRSSRPSSTRQRTCEARGETGSGRRHLVRSAVYRAKTARWRESSCRAGQHFGGGSRSQPQSSRSSRRARRYQRGASCGLSAHGGMTAARCDQRSATRELPVRLPGVTARCAPARCALRRRARDRGGALPASFETRDDASAAALTRACAQLGMVGRRRKRFPRCRLRWMSAEADARSASLTVPLQARIGRPVELTDDQATARPPSAGSGAATPMLRCSRAMSVRARQP